MPVTGDERVLFRAGKRRVLLVSLLSLGVWSIFPTGGDAQYAKFSGDWQPGTPGPAVDTSPAAIRRTVKELQAFPEEEFPSAVPPAAALGLATLKHQLRDLLLQALKGSTEVQASAVREVLEQQLLAAGVELIGSDWNRRTHPYGNVVGIKVETPSEMTGGLAVTTTLAIPCGEDSSLYLLRREEGRWQLQIAVESDGYTKISGAQGNLRYAASPRDASGEWFAVVTRTNPWCTSNWHAIQYRVLRPAESPYEPRELFSKVAGIYLGYDDMEKLVATKTSLHLSFWDWQGLSVDLFTRARVENYEVVGQTVKRRPPIANSPEGFLNEWSDLA